MAIPDANLGPNNLASSNDNASVDSGVGSYLIKKGDNLTNIAKNNNTTIGDILKSNPQISNPDLIYTGSKLSLPAPPVSTNQRSLNQDLINSENLSVYPNNAVSEEDRKKAIQQEITAEDLSVYPNNPVSEEARQKAIQQEDLSVYPNNAVSEEDRQKAIQKEITEEDLSVYPNNAVSEEDRQKAIQKEITEEDLSVYPNNAVGEVDNTRKKSLNINGSSSGSPDSIIGAGGKAVTPFLRDYQHASKLFWSGQVPDGQKGLMPKNGFLFHVVFDLSPNVTRDFSLAELGMLVKSVSLPKFTVDLKQQNAYNRVNFTQTKIKYDPVTITFHDDSSNVVRDFWFSYFNYYYRDSDYSEPLYQIKHKYNERSAIDWGYKPKKPKNSEFLNTIRIFSLHQKNFSEYVLINPIIRSFKHGDHRYEDGNGLMSHDMTVEYETVLYYSGSISEDTVKGFGSIHYDRTPSPNLGKEQNLVGPGSTTDKTNKGANRLPNNEKTAGSDQSTENPQKKPPAKDWITGVGDSVFGDSMVGKFVTNKIFVPMAKSVAYNATSKATIAINKTIGQSIAKVQGALGPTIGGIIVPAVTEGFGGIPNVGTYLINNGSNIASNTLKKAIPWSQEISQPNNTPKQMSTASAISILPTTDQNSQTNLVSFSSTNQGQPQLNSIYNQAASTTNIDAMIKTLSKSMAQTQQQLSKYQNQIEISSTNMGFFNNQIDKTLSEDNDLNAPAVKKLQNYLDQQKSLKDFYEQKVAEANQQLIELDQSKQKLIKGFVKK